MASPLSVILPGSAAIETARANDSRAKAREALTAMESIKAAGKTRIEVVTGITMALKSQQGVAGSLRAKLLQPLDQTA